MRAKDADDKYLELLERSLPPLDHPNRDRWRQYALGGPGRLRPHVDDLVASMGSPRPLLDLGCGDGASIPVAGVPVALVGIQLEALRRASARPGSGLVVLADGSPPPPRNFLSSPYERCGRALVRCSADFARGSPGAATRRHRPAHHRPPLRAAQRLGRSPWGPIRYRRGPNPPCPGVRGANASPREFLRRTPAVHRRSLTALLRTNGLVVRPSSRPSIIPPTVVAIDVVRGR